MMLELPAGWPEPKPGPLIKICGLADPVVAFGAVNAGADMVGVVYFEPSPRHVGPAVARDVADAVRGAATVVLLTVNANDRELDALVQRVGPDALQLHGSESPERVSEIAARYDLPVSKALGVGSAADLEGAAAYTDTLLLVDAKPPPEADRPGGLGATFDWSLLHQLDPKRPFMLSGGLNADNVGGAVKALRPYAVDVSSGVERDGKKDPAKIKAFIASVRGGPDAG